MKKILAIVSMAAMVAGAAFAADVSAKVKIDGSLFNYANNKSISMLKVTHGGEDWNPELSFSFNGDLAGTSFKIYDGKATDGTTIQTTGWSTWFKPIDMLKFTIGEFSTNLNQEKIDWSNTETGIDTYGYAASLSTSGFGLDVFFAPGWDTYWFSKADGADATVGDIYVKAGYGASFGTINGFFEMPSKDNYKFGAGYSNTFGTVSMFINGFGWMNKKEDAMGFAHIRAEAYASTTVGSVTLSTFIAGGTNRDAGYWDWRVGCGQEKGATLGATFKASMPVGSVTPYLYIKSGDFLAEKLGLEIKPGVTGNVGEMAYEVALDINYDASKVDPEQPVSVNVPISFTVNF